MVTQVVVPAYEDIAVPQIDSVSDFDGGNPRLKSAIDQVSETKGYLTTLTSFVNEPEKTQAETAATDAPAFIQEAADVVKRSKDGVILADVTAAVVAYNAKAQAYKDVTVALND